MVLVDTPVWSLALDGALWISHPPNGVLRKPSMIW